MSILSDFLKRLTKIFKKEKTSTEAKPINAFSKQLGLEFPNNKPTTSLVTVPIKTVKEPIEKKITFSKQKSKVSKPKIKLKIKSKAKSKKTQSMLKPKIKPPKRKKQVKLVSKEKSKPLSPLVKKVKRKPITNPKRKPKEKSPRKKISLAIKKELRLAPKFAIELKKYSVTVKNLRKEINSLKRKIETKQVEPKKALGTIQVVYNEIKGENRNIDKEIKQTKNLMNLIEGDFLKRKISQEMFRTKMFDYQEKIHILKMEKKELGVQKKDLNLTTKKIPSSIPINLEQLSKTNNVENLLKKQQQILEKIAKKTTPNVLIGTEVSKKNSKTVVPKTVTVIKAEPVQATALPQQANTGISTRALPKEHLIEPIKVSSSQDESQEEPKKEVSSKSEDSQRFSKQVIPKAKASNPKQVISPVKVIEKNQIRSILKQKTNNQINNQKLNALEEKLTTLVNQNKISVKEIDRELGEESTEKLIESINRLTGKLELKGVRSSELQKPMNAIRFKEPTEKIEKKEKIKEKAITIKKYKIVTDFDKVFNFVTKKGQVKVGEISKQIGISFQRAEECCNILQKENQIKIIYPPIGDAVIQTIDYADNLEIEKLKKKEQKRKELEEKKAKKNG